MKFGKFLTKLTATVMMAAVLAVPAASALPVLEGTVVEAEAATKNGFIKKSGKWYYYQNGQKATGLQSIDGKLYWFNSKGVMKAGKKSVGGYTYYFEKVSDGKCPAVTNTEKTISGVAWYFGSTGRGFRSVGNATGNKAVAQIVDNVSFNASMGKKDKLLACYNYILSYCDYLGKASPSLSSGWYNSCANDMITSRKGKCYHYAAITYLAAKAMGYSCTLYTGTVDRNLDDDKKEAAEHAWVKIGKYIVDSCFDDTNKKDGNQYFFKTYAALKKSERKSYTEGKAY